MERTRTWALPRITGPAWWPFLAVWSLLLATCLWSSAMVLPGIARSFAGPITAREAVGIAMRRMEQGPVVASVGPGAAKAGLRRGDRLVSIDGRRVTGSMQELDRQLAGPSGSRLDVVATSPSGSTRHLTLVRDPVAYRGTLAAVGLTPHVLTLLNVGLRFLFSEVLLLVCAVLLMVKRSRDALAPWASLMMLCLLLGDNTGAGRWFYDLFPGPLSVYMIANTVAYAMLFAVLSVFPTGQFEPRWSLAVALTGAAQAILAQVLPQDWTNITLAAVFAAIVAAIATRFRRMPPGTGRQQIRWALLGFAASVLAQLLYTIFEFAFEHTDTLGMSSWLRVALAVSGTASSSLQIAFITVSLLRYRLYDADATISRSVVYGALTLGLLGTFAGSERLIEIMGEAYLGERLGSVAGVLGAAVAAVMIVPLHDRVTIWAEKRFRGNLVRLRHGLPILAGDMRETATPRELADAMLIRIKDGVRAVHGAVVAGEAVVDVRDIAASEVEAWLAGAAVLENEDRALRCDRADPLFPVRLPLYSEGPGLVGWLLLGPRPDGTFYGREEREALREIADPVARALAIALQRERTATAQQEREDRLARQFEALRQFVMRQAGHSAR